MRFWDASAIVPLLCAQSESARAQTGLSADPVIAPSGAGRIRAMNLRAVTEDRNVSELVQEAFDRYLEASPQ